MGISKLSVMVDKKGAFEKVSRYIDIKIGDKYFRVSSNHDNELLIHNSLGDRVYIRPNCSNEVYIG